MTTEFVFKIGDHGLASKRGHCTACSALEATVTVQAVDIEQAVERANQALGNAQHSFAVGHFGEPDSWVRVTTKTTITKRQLVKPTKKGR
jgi:hypothetical protein